MSKRVAVSVESINGMDSIMDPRFGRATGYVIVDIDSGQVVAEMENKGKEAAQGAGTGAAAMLSNLGVTVVVSGMFGPKAFAALEALGVEMWTAPPHKTVGEIISQYVSGGLKRENMPTGGGRGGGRGRGMWGGGQGRGRGAGGGQGMGQGRGMGQGGGQGMGGQGMRQAKGRVGSGNGGKGR